MSTDWIIPREVPADKTLRELARQYREADPSAIETLLMLFRVTADIHTAMAQRFSRHNLSHGRFVVLVMLHTEGGEMCCSALADSIGVTRATMTGLLDSLERDGFIRRVDNSEDRRRTTITLTANGRRFLDEVLPGHFAAVAALMESLNESERKKLRESLGKLRSSNAVLLKP
jgi:DNA-binding MarR family transcriptional regulator